MLFYNLNSIPTGQSCRVRWLTGRIADTFRKIFSLVEDTDVYMIKNHGSGGLIVRCGNKRLAMSRDAADYIKVECVSA